MSVSVRIIRNPKLSAHLARSLARLLVDWLIGKFQKDSRLFVTCFNDLHIPGLGSVWTIFKKKKKKRRKILAQNNYRKYWFWD